MDRAIKKKKWTLRKILINGVLPLGALALIFLMVRSSSVSRLKVESDRITQAEITYGPFQEFIPINGDVLPLNIRFIDAILGGQVEEVFLEGGELVKKGDIILKLSNPGTELSFMNSETSLLEQADQLRNTRITMEDRGLNFREQLIRIEGDIIAQKIAYERNEKLFKDGVISEADYLDTKLPYELSLRQRDLTKLRLEKDSMLREAQLDQVNSSLNLVYRNLKAIQKNLEFLTVKAPVAGQLSSIRVEIGETVTIGQQLAQIDLQDGFKVRAPIDEHYVARIEKGLKGEFPFAGQTYHLVVRKVYPEVQANGTFEVDMDFVGETPADLKRGQNLQIRLALSEETQAILIPRGGFFQSTGGNWVYVVDKEQGIATKRSIRIGRQSDRFYEVTEGLEPGETVITSGYDAFNEMDVLVLQ